MSYLRFDKTLMTNLEESLTREILRTNRSGAYHCSTIVDCNTRKYHGLLVIPVPELDDENHVLLSSLDETVIQHGAEFNLGLHKYHGDNFSPRGHKYIREFECEKVPTTIYRVGGVVLKKEKLFVHHENRILIRYTLLEAHSRTTLRLRPYLAFRSVRQYTHENAQASRHYDVVKNGIKTCMYPGYPELFMQTNCPNEFHFQPDWYRGIEYPKEQERGYDFNEDLYVPGYFEIEITKDQPVVFSGGISEIETANLDQLFSEEADRRTPRDNFKHCLINAAHQFLNKQGDESYVLAGYPWFKCRARDMFISLPGLMLAVNEVDKFEMVMNTASKAIYEFMKGEPATLKVYEMEHPDVLLWAVWTIQQYAKMVSRDAARSKYGTLLKDIMAYLSEGKHPNLKVCDNGLVYAQGRDKAITWMNATSNGRPVTPRTGYIVEFNTLWYNALMFVGELLVEGGDTEFAGTLTQLAEKASKAFVDTFLNEYGYLLDYVDGDMMDWSVRPNMIFAAAFDYSPLNAKQKKGVVDIVTKELLTPKGLRSLSPKSGGYNPNYVGPQVQRDYAYHQGTAWPWLEGFYLEAYLRIYKRSAISFVERQMISFEDELSLHCVGSIKGGNTMKVLMFGWEFPPHILGGLGTASYGLTKGLAQQEDMQITFCIPKPWGDEDQSFLKIIGMNSVPIVWRDVQWDYVKNRVGNYMDPQLYYDLRDHIYADFNYMHTNDLGCMEFSGRYPDNLHEEINNYSIVAGVVARQQDFDIIHSHDWLTYPAGIHAKQVSGKPLVIHVHATDFDRSRGNVNPTVYSIEKNGMDHADCIMCVSELTRQTVINKYYQDPRKVFTVHNAVSPLSQEIQDIVPHKNPKEKIVTFLGRITMQKGPEYFVEAAAMVLKRAHHVRFVMAGSGDMMDAMIRLAAERGIADRFHFPGFMRGKQVYEVLKASDVYIMPSVSEPFGISPLEAMQCSVPTIISKQSGCAEILSKCIKTDYWDIHAMADAIHAICTYPALYEYLRDEGKKEVDGIVWEKVGVKIRGLYEQTLKNCGQL